MTYDNPTRYELNDPNADSVGPTAKMESHYHGDYVMFEDYEELLGAFNELTERLANIAGIASQ